MNEQTSILFRAALRLIRTFLFSGIASVAALTLASGQFATIKDLKTWAVSVVIAFISGGIAGIDKAIRG